MRASRITEPSNYDNDGIIVIKILVLFDDFGVKN